MNVSPDKTNAVIIRPPQLIRSLVGGFNAVANHIYLILVPVLLDLLLWFGPHVRVKTLFEPAMMEMIQITRQSSTPEMIPLVDNVKTLWTLLLEQYNLLAAVSTFPVGIPTMMSGQLPIHTPLGDPRIYEIASLGQFILVWLGLSLTGIVLGTLFFSGLAHGCANYLVTNSGELKCDEDPAVQDSQADNAEATTPVEQISLDPVGVTAAAKVITQKGYRLPPFNLSTLAWEFLQVFALIIIGLIVLAIVMVPSFVIASLLSLISPFLSQIILLLVSLGAIWLLIPLVFSPHGIFLCGQSVINAMLNSARVVRYTLPGTSIFLIIIVVLNQGMGMLWRQPPDTSWMAFVGIFGNAVITTGLLAASFIYYRGGLIYVESIRRLGTRLKFS